MKTFRTYLPVDMNMYGRLHWPVNTSLFIFNYLFFSLISFFGYFFI